MGGLPQIAALSLVQRLLQALPMQQLLQGSIETLQEVPQL